MQTQILKYKKIQKVITESGPSLPGLAQSAAWGTYIFAVLGLFHAGCFISRFASTEYRRLNFGPLLSSLLLNQLWFKISQSLRA